MKWKVKKLHDHCKECSECAANAVQHALKTNASKAQSAIQDSLDSEATPLHWAGVEAL